MENYERKYYDYQTKARGLLSVNVLHKNFDKLAHWYGYRFKKYLQSEKDAQCLDVPCGYGNFLFFLKRNGYMNTIGYDLDTKQIDLAKLMELPAKIGDAFEVLENENKNYDLISSMDFIEHLSKEKALEFLKLCFDHLNNGGILIIRTPCADGPFGAHDVYNDITHKWGMTSNLLNSILDMLGFTEVIILDERPQPTSILNVVRWLIFPLAKFVVNCICLTLGLRPPVIWTRSMIAIGRKVNIS